MKVLIVDATPESRLSLAALVADCGHDVRTVDSGDAALEAYGQERPDLVLLDVNLPEMDGYEVARCLRGMGGDDWMPIIYLKPAMEDQEFARGLAAGGDDYLVKPIAPGALNAKLQATQRIADLRQRLISLSARCRQADIELELRSQHDALTGLANRRAFEETLQRECKRAARTGRPLSMVLLDVDRFRAYNQAHGHLAGDECLTRISAALRTVLRRANDMVARLGGDRYAALMPETDADGALNVTERMRAAVNEMRIPHPQADTAPYVTVSSATLTLKSTEPTTAEDVLARVAAAVRAAKSAGGDRIVAAAEPAPGETM